MVTWKRWGKLLSSGSVNRHQTTVPESFDAFFIDAEEDSLLRRGKHYHDVCPTGTENHPDRIRDNYYARGEKGMYLGGQPPFGFLKVDIQTEHGKLKMLEPNPDTVDTLVRIFKMYGEDMMSLCAIARQFNSEAVRAPKGKHWGSSKVSRILRNPVAAQSSSDIYHYYRNRGIRFTNNIADFAFGKGFYLYGKRSTQLE